jgi:DNA polymerase I-like protein with 3'-5' exonuclease and polymerase domains
MTGVHADLAAIEPTVTAFYSDDPHLLKVFRDGLGDIYLDLALELFPRDRELREGYSPQAPVTDAIKKRFSKQRKIAKVVQLAVQYTGTGYTVASNLTKNGVPTTVAEAEGYVRAYWRKFHRVAQFNDALFTAYARTGSLRNLMGRIIRVPSPDYKDLPNRFIQSSAHDFLMAWVLRIYRLCAERGINVSPVLLDCHDSTSNAVPTEQVDALKQTYLDALAQLNAEVGINAKCEIKTFLTLAGLKADE